MINTYPTVKEALDDAKEEMKDFTESKIYQGINEGNTALIIFYAKTQMKDRGYVERQETTGKDGGPIEVAAINLSELSDGQLKRLRPFSNFAGVVSCPTSYGPMSTSLNALTNLTS
jgi:hypothetical protein